MSNARALLATLALLLAAPPVAHAGETLRLGKRDWTPVAQVAFLPAGTETDWWFVATDKPVDCDGLRAGALVDPELHHHRVIADFSERRVGATANEVRAKEGADRGPGREVSLELVVLQVPTDVAPAVVRWTLGDRSGEWTAPTCLPDALETAMVELDQAETALEEAYLRGCDTKGLQGRLSSITGAQAPYRERFDDLLEGHRSIETHLGQARMFRGTAGDDLRAWQDESASLRAFVETEVEAYRSACRALQSDVDAALAEAAPTLTMADLDSLELTRLEALVEANGWKQASSGFGGQEGVSSLSVRATRGDAEVSVIVWRGDDSGERRPGAIEQRTKLYARGVSRYDAACDCAVAVIPEDTAWEAEAAELFGALGF